MAEVHRILKEMYIGMAVCMIVFLAIGAFFMRPYYIFALCYWRSIEPDNVYVSDSIAALKDLEKGS